MEFLKSIRTAVSFTVAVMVTAMTLRADAPQRLSYQALVFDAAGEPVASGPVGVRISILSDASDGTVVYAETHAATSDLNGLVTLEIGGGTAVAGSFTAIAWETGIYFLKTETDPAGGTNYSITAVSQLLSVPYALYAGSASSSSGFDGDMEGRAITNLADPVDAQDAATKAYVDAVATVPFLSRTQLDSITPVNGQLVYNSTDAVTVMWNGTNWIQVSDNCFPQPTPARAGDDQEVTGDSAVTTMAADAPAEGTGIWSVVSGTGGSFTDEHDPETEFRGTGCTSYGLRWTVTTVCDSSSSDVTVFFNAVPTTAEAGSSITVTTGDTSVTLGAVAPTTGTGAWSVISGGSGSFSDASDPAAVFTGNHCTSYMLYWTVTTACHSSVDSMEVTFDATPSDANAGNDIHSPDSVSATLGANAPDAWTDGAWTVVSGSGGSFSDSTDHAAVFSGNDNTAYTLRWTLSTPCHSSYDDVNVYFGVVIGQYMEGGVVYYIDSTGEHGQVVSLDGDWTGIEWGCEGTSIATGSAIGTGAANTAAIMAGCATAGIAARQCDALESGGYDDWFLPSDSELGQIRANQSAVAYTLGQVGGTGFTGTIYGSSTEYTHAYSIWAINLGSGVRQDWMKRYTTGRYRAVRAF